MFPMSPLQSWAFLILLFGTVSLVVWALLGRAMDRLDENDEQNSTDDEADASTASPVWSVSRSHDNEPYDQMKDVS